MHEPETQTGSDAHFGPSARKSFRYDDFARPSASTRKLGLLETRERIPRSCGGPFGLLHKPAIQFLCAGQVRQGGLRIYRETCSTEACQLSQIQLGRERLSSLLSQGL